MHRKGFTLLELLIVVGILAVLATVAVLVINPLEYLRQSRDAKRVSDIKTLSKALELADFEGASLGGASTTVFVSLLDTASSTCGTLGLPSLPSGYQYRCVTTEANLRKIDGTGWIPVNFSALTARSPLASLPVDPTNSNSRFYSYIPGGSFALSASLESDKFIKQSALTDGGHDPAKIEMGSDLKLLAKADGLVGYWPLNDGSGSVANDVSGNGITGTIAGTPSWTSGKIGGALNFDGTTNSISISNPIAQTNTSQEWTVTTWAKLNPKTSQTLINLNSGAHLVYSATNRLLLYLNSGANDYYDYGYYDLQDNAWHHVAFVFKNSTGLREIYVDGVDVSAPGPNNTSLPYGNPGTLSIGVGALGTLDDVKIYTRALSAQEIKDAYTATK